MGERGSLVLVSLDRSSVYMNRHTQAVDGVVWAVLIVSMVKYVDKAQTSLLVRVQQSVEDALWDRCGDRNGGETESNGEAHLGDD